MSFKSRVAACRERVDAQLDLHLKSGAYAPRLLEAMRYSTFNGGKRLRPVLVYAANQALGGEMEAADAPACAIECIHAYSLVHDDLPAMDDDDLRRGKPTCHIAFDEATAILAGDALLTLGFDLLAHPQAGMHPQTQIEMLRTLAQASGHHGMVAGQAIDMAAVGEQLTLAQLEQMHALKTGALIRAAVRLGALSSGVASAGDLHCLDRYAKAIGLAFQVQDDILDIESDTATLGKRQGADQALDKPTYPALLGLDGAKRKARELHAEALASLDELHPQGSGSNPESAHLLRQIADYIIARDH